MPPDNSTNAPPSGPTSRSAPKTPLSESQFLTKQSADARAAIERVVADMKNDLARGVDPRQWMQTNPWTTLATAAVAGFVAAAAIVPSEEQQALRRLRKIEDALHAQEHERQNDDRDRPPRESFLAALAGQVLRAVQPVLMSAISAAVTAKATQPQPPTGVADPNANGHHTQSGAGPSEMPDI